MVSSIMNDKEYFYFSTNNIPSHGYNPTESIPRVKQKNGWIMNVKTQSAHKDIVFVGTWTFSKLLVFLGDKRDVQMIEKGARIFRTSDLEQVYWEPCDYIIPMSENVNCVGKTYQN